jgi:hypothetical protein
MYKLSTLLTIVSLSTLTVGCAPPATTDHAAPPAAETGAPATPDKPAATPPAAEKDKPATTPEAGSTAK